MGSPEDEVERFDDEIHHEVTLKHWLADSTVTQALWRAVMGENPSYFKGENRPVEQVSWEDSKYFIDKLNQLQTDMKVCLPWEAEWEYACRAGTRSPFFFGDNITSEQVNYNGNFPYPGGNRGQDREKTVLDKSLPPNAWGLYEMHGNIWEWCEDVWQEYLGTESVTDPWERQATPESGVMRVIRGGSWFNYGRRVRSAMRNGYEPDVRHDVVGFRLALGH